MYNYVTNISFCALVTSESLEKWKKINLMKLKLGVDGIKIMVSSEGRARGGSEVGDNCC